MNYGKLTAGTTKTAIDTAKPSEKGEIITYLSRMGDVLIKDGDGVVCAFEIQLYRFGDGSVVLYHQNTVAHGIISLPSTFYHSRAHGCLPKCYRADI